MTTAESYSVELEMFEGPLDLLLHLVRKHELNVLDIPVGFVTSKYLEYLDRWQNLDVDVAAEYLLMAATLCHIKSRELLPRDATQAEPEELVADEVEVEDPRAELIRRLLEYQKYKEVGLALGNRPVVGRNVWMRGADIEDVLPDEVNPELAAPLQPFPVGKLIEAFERMMQRAKLKVSHNVIIDRLSVSQKISELTDLLDASPRLRFEQLFSFLRDGREVTPQEVRHEAVVTFLAILELGKLRLIRITQKEGDDEIIVERASDDLRGQVSASVAGADDYR